MKNTVAFRILLHEGPVLNFVSLASGQLHHNAQLFSTSFLGGKLQQNRNTLAAHIGLLAGL